MRRVAAALLARSRPNQRFRAATEVPGIGQDVPFAPLAPAGSRRSRLGRQRARCAPRVTAWPRATPFLGELSRGTTRMLSLVMLGGLCTFCDELLDGSVEHLLHSALGGRKTSKGVVCGVHNNLFGTTIDRVLTDQLAVIGNLLGIRTGRNQPAATIRGLETLDGQRVDVEPGGRLVLPRSNVRDDISDGRRDITISANSIERASALTAQYMRRYPGRDLENATIVESIVPTHRPLRIDGAVGGEDAHRAIAKIAVVFVASAVGTEAVRGASAAAIRKFVLEGGDSADFVRMDYATPFPEVPDLGDFAVHAHRVAVFGDPSARVACGFVELFGAFRYTILISDAWDGPAMALHYAVDPVTALHSEVSRTMPAPITPTQFHALRSSPDDARSYIERLWAAISARQADLRLERVIRDVFAEMFPPERLEQPTPEERMTAAREITARFMAEHCGVPYSRTRPLEASIRAEPENE